MPGPGAAAAGAAEDGPVSLGSATVDQLDEIEGIGPVTAEKIIEFRDEKGGLSSVDQLDEISGVGPSTMEALRSGLQPVRSVADHAAPVLAGEGHAPAVGRRVLARRGGVVREHA